MKKLLVVDPLCESGHLKINREFLKTLTSAYNVTFVTEFNYLKKLKIDNLNIEGKYFRLKSNNIANRVFRLKQMIYILETIKFYNKGDYEAIVFLSYETISISLIANFFKINNLILFEHNNIDQTTNSKIKYYFYKKLSKKSSFSLVFEEYIKEYLENEFNRQCFVVKHPVFYRKNETVNNVLKDNIIVFSPSSTYDKKIMETLITYCRNKKILIYAKGDIELKNRNVIISSYFENYKKIMDTANVVAISNKFEYRVSGVFYEAMSLSKKIIGPKTQFLTNMKEKYPSSILLFDDLNNIHIDKNFINMDNKHEVESFFLNHSKYEDELITSINNIIGKSK